MNIARLVKSMQNHSFWGY